MIKPVEVKRDEYGYWTHPDLPSFNEAEYIPPETWNNWCEENKITTLTILMGDDDDETLMERYCADDNFSLIEWKPDIDEKGAFLLSIFETEEDGPAAAFAIPTE